MEITKGSDLAKFILKAGNDYLREQITVIKENGHDQLNQNHLVSLQGALEKHQTDIEIMNRLIIELKLTDKDFCADDIPF